MGAWGIHLWLGEADKRWECEGRSGVGGRKDGTARLAEITVRWRTLDSLKTGPGAMVAKPKGRNRSLRGLKSLWGTRSEQRLPLVCV